MRRRAQAVANCRLTWQQPAYPSFPGNILIIDKKDRPPLSRETEFFCPTMNDSVSPAPSTKLCFSAYPSNAK
jgi:hypothetical protein